MWQEDLVAKLDSAKPTERKAVLEKFRVLTGHTPQHLYRVAKANGFNAGRKSREDKGKFKSELSVGQIEFVASLMFVTGRENKGPIMPVERAIQIAEDNGIIEPGQVSPATMNRILREWQMSKRHMRAPDPHVNMRSLHPNHVHLVDVSVCVQYYLKNGRTALMDERDFNKNKPQNCAKVKTRLLRYLLVDHFSGEFFLRYYDTTGETAENLFNFLKEAWGKKDNDKAPCRGVPFVLLMDSGSANVAHAIVAMLRRLGVDVPKGRPYNPRRQGAVETTHNIIENWFESGLRIQPAFDVPTLNVLADDWMVRFKATKPHTRHGMPRTQMWLTIKPHELRELPDDEVMQEFYAKPEEECTVNGDYSIQFKGKRFNVKHAGVAPRMRVTAIMKPLKWKDGLVDVVHNGVVYECNEVTTLPSRLGGFRADAAVIGVDYKAQPETATQEAIKRFENMAFGEDRKKGAIPFDGLRIFGHHAAEVKGLEFMPKTGTPMEVDRSITAKSMSMTAFLVKLKNAVGTVPQELNASLRAQYGDSIDVKEAEEVIRRHKDGDGGAEEITVKEVAG